MFSEDYIIRIIRQAVAVLARLIGLKAAGEYQKAVQAIDQALEQLLGMDAQIIRLMDDESLYRILTKNDGLDVQRLGLIADLFKEKAAILHLQGQINESITCFIRSLNYYLTISLESQSPCPVELSTKIDECLQQCAPHHLEEKTLWNLFCHYENAAQFARAAAILDQLASRPQSSSTAMEETRSFYQRLLEKSPQELAAGGITRSHIRARLKELD